MSPAPKSATTPVAIERLPLIVTPVEVENVFVVVPPRVRLLKVVAEEPLIDCAVPQNITVPLLGLKLALFVKLPAKVSVFEVEVKLPPLRVRLFNETALLPKLSVPAPPNTVRLVDGAEMAPPMVSVFAVTVICLLAFRVVAPVPKFKLFVPAKLKSPFKFNG